MRDSREKGAGMRDQDPRFQTLLQRLWKNFYFIKLYAETYETLLLDSHNKQNMGLQKV